jgi:prophage regulatory protein
MTARNLIRLTEVKSLTGVGTSFIYQKMKQGLFPRRCKVGRLSAWEKSEVLAWIEQRLSERDAESAGPSGSARNSGND